MACPKCQKTNKGQTNKEVLHPLPQCSAPNQRLHMDLFGPLKTPNRSKAYIMCMTDAFTKYVEVQLVQDKMANTIAQVIFDSWICRFGVPIQIVTDGGKEFCNKVTADLYEKLRISHSVTTPAHPQCNAQAEVANKHFQKYLSRMCDNNTLVWEHLLPPMAFAYNTSVHSTTGLTPSYLMFGFNPLTPGLVPPSLDESDNNNRLQALQRARDAANIEMTRQSLNYQTAHDKSASPVILTPGQQVLLDVRLFVNANRKLAEHWEGPFFVYQVHPKGVIDILRNNKLHRVNIDRLKPFIPEPVQIDINPNDNVVQNTPLPLMCDQDIAPSQQIAPSIPPPTVSEPIIPRGRGRPKRRTHRCEM